MSKEFNYGEDLAILEALRVVSSERRRDYDDPLPNHERIAQIWNVQIEPKLSRDLSARDVALMMIGLKLAREAFTPKEDNIIDVIGYAQCVQFIDHPGLVARCAGIIRRFMTKFGATFEGGDSA